MFEARLASVRISFEFSFKLARNFALIQFCFLLILQAQLLKKIVEALKDLVTDANLECTSEALTLQVRVDGMTKGF